MILTQFVGMLKIKLEKLRKNNKQVSYTVKTGEHIQTSFGISVCYPADVKYKKNEYFCDRGEVCLDVFVGKMNKNLSNLLSRA